MTDTDTDRDRRGIRSTLLRWRAPLVLVPLLLALGYAGVLGARLLWAEVAPDPVTAPVVACWDGSEASAPDCPPPTGLAGLRWVFPSFRPFGGACDKVVYKKGRGTRPLAYVCTVRLGGRTARVTYSERSDLEGSLDFFARRYDEVRPVSTAGGARLVYSDPAPRKNGTYEAAVALTTYPFSVTVSAVNERLRDAVLDKRVGYRASRFLRIQPVESPTGQPGS